MSTLFLESPCVEEITPPTLGGVPQLEFYPMSPENESYVLKIPFKTVANKFF